jgi:hypothetical protein
MRETVPVVSTVHDGPTADSIDTHPAFGVAVVSRSSGTGRVLFQSDLKHNESITLSIRTAERARGLHHDWVHPRGELVEVEMSLAQWGSLVSSIGLGSGVPVTIRSTETNRQVPELPYQPRMAQTMTEARESVTRLLTRVRETFASLEDAITEKRGVKEIRNALGLHRSSIEHAGSNTDFAVKSMKEAAETVTSQARADIEAQILGAQMIVGGQASIEAPDITFELEA